MSLARHLQEIQHSSQELSGYKLARNNSNYQLLIQNLFNITKYYLTLEAFFFILKYTKIEQRQKLIIIIIVM